MNTKPAKLNLAATVSTFLRNHAEQKFTARDIATWILENYPEECRAKQARSQANLIPLDSDDALIQQFVAEIGSQRPSMQRKYPSIKTIEDRPRKYYFTRATDSDEVSTAEGKKPEKLDTYKRAAIGTAIAPENPRLTEHDLYPMLSAFLWAELNIYSKRIDERRGSNKQGAGGNKWLYPDVVGLEDFSRDWHEEIKKCATEYADIKTALWSFEVKILINRSNVREAFFQAVSNGAWANYSYLVASSIEGVDTMKELRMLSGLHGVGFMQLDVAQPAEKSQIVIPAKARDAVDWHTANRLAKENKDFMAYITRIREFYQTGNVHAQYWDTPKDSE